jgi:hypothetical protein
MKSTKMLTILVLALAPMANAAQYLRVNGQDVNSITLRVGQSCDIELASDNNSPYVVSVGFDDGNTLGNFGEPQTMWQAGEMVIVTEVNEAEFYGYSIDVGVDVTDPNRPRAGLHFIFRYKALAAGESDVKLYQDSLPPAATLIDTVHISVETGEATIPLATGFTYQGRLQQNGLPVNTGQFDFRFKLYDRESGGIQLGGTETREAVDVSDEGYFTVEDLDFGREVFNGNDRWLEIWVHRRNDPNDYQRLSPRQRLAPTPYSIHSRGLTIPNDETHGDKPILIKQYRALGNKITYDTGIDPNCWTCGIFGFRTKGGDIEQTGSSDIVYLYLYAKDKNGTPLDTWHLKANFKDDEPNENWYVNIICFHRDLVYYDDPFPQILHE